MWRPSEDKFGKSGKRDLLIEKGSVLFQYRVFAEIVGEPLEGGKIATVEGKQELS